MSLWKGIAVSRFPQGLGQKKRDVVRTSRVVEAGAEAEGRRPKAGTGYFGAPCTASVTTARVSDGASISRKV